jgi:hypothetical protein
MMTKVATTLRPTFSLLDSTTSNRNQQANMAATTNMTENISVDLDQLLTRLSDTLLSPTADDSHIRATPYERNRISAVNTSLLRPIFSCPPHHLSVKPEITQVLTTNNRMSNMPEPSSCASNTPPKTSKSKPKRSLSKTISPTNATS